MILQKFIDEKTIELKQLNLYKDVALSKAYDIELCRNGSSEDFISVDSDLNKQISQDKSLLGDELQAGSRIVFDVLEKRKRKYTTKSFYVIYI